MNYYLSPARLAKNIAIGISVLALASCAVIKTGSHYDETINFSAYETFSWVSETPYISDETSIRISPLSQTKIQAAIRKQLTLAGYTFVDTPGNADFVIAYTVGTRDKIRVGSYPIDYPGSWGWHLRGSHFTVRETYNHQYTEGSLGVDMFDGESNQPIWHGWAEKTISDSDRKYPGPVIEQGIAQLFSKFPQ